MREIAKLKIRYDNIFGNVRSTATLYIRAAISSLTNLLCPFFRLSIYTLRTVLGNINFSAAIRGRKLSEDFIYQIPPSW